MKVLLVQSYLGRYDAESSVFPIGLCYIATALAGHEVKVFDPNISQNASVELRGVLKSFRPEVVGVSLRNIDTTQRRNPVYYFKDFEDTVRLVRETDTSIKIIVGGTGFSMFARQIMERVPELDFGIYLEGEESIVELLNNLNAPERVKGVFMRRDGNVIFTGPRAMPDIASLPIPRRDFIDIQRYDHPLYANIGIQTKRGCPLKCAYCSYPFLNGRRIRTRSAVQVVDEIEYLMTLGIHRFMFADSVFNIPERHAEEICREIIRRKLSVTWSAWFDIKRFSEELLGLALRAGCSNFSFSPDAASDKSLNALGKDISEKDIARVIEMLRKINGIRTEFNFFCTPPGQDFFGFLKTLLLYFKITFLFKGRGTVILSWIRIEPETRIHQIAVKDNLIDGNTDLLPQDEKALQGLFYSCPSVRWYADPVFNMLLWLQERLKPLIKKILGRGLRTRSEAIAGYGS